MFVANIKKHKCMKTKIFFFLAVISGMLTTSCEEPATGMYVSDHYIQLYYDMEEISASVRDNFPGIIFIGYEAEEYSKGGKTEPQYMALAERYNDFGYDQAVYPGMYRAVSNEFTGIDVVSDKDFNGIPAGQSLGSVVKLLSASAKRYIDSKYSEWFNWGDNLPDDYIVNGVKLLTEDFEYGFFPVYGTLDSLDPAELVLLYYSCICLTFTETPAIKEHNLTITFSDAEKDFPCKLAYTFM
jgi:hypothetical protein